MPIANTTSSVDTCRDCSTGECERRVAALRPDFRARLPCVALAMTEAEVCRSTSAPSGADGRAAAGLPCARSTALQGRCVDRGGPLHKYCVLAWVVATAAFAVHLVARERHYDGPDR